MVELEDLGDGGNIIIQNDDIVLEYNYYTAIYLCMFGGNISEKDYFGNLLISEDESKYTSETERYLIDNISNLDFDLLKSYIRTDILATFQLEISNIDIINNNKILSIKIFIYDETYTYLIDKKSIQTTTYKVSEMT